MSANQNSSTLDKVNFSKFTLKRILNNNSNRKTICVLGTFEDLSAELALIILEKISFTEENVKSGENGFFSNQSIFEMEFVNDIYGNFKCITTNPDINCNTFFEVNQVIVY